MFYSTSFDIVIGREKNWLLTDFRYLEAAEESKPLFEVVQVSGEYGLTEFLKEKNPQSLGIERSVITVKEYDGIREVIRPVTLSLPTASWKRAESSKTTENWKKSDRRQRSQTSLFPISWIGSVPGVSEREIAWLLERKMREEGASALSFDTICASGVRSSMPHAHPTDALIENGDFVTMDFGCVFEGYCSDMTRTVAVGSVSDEQKEIYRIVLEPRDIPVM